MNTQQPTVSEPNSMGGMNAEEKALIEPKLGDRVRFTGTVVKSGTHWNQVAYKDAPAPYFEGYGLDEDRKWVLTKHYKAEGFIVGKRLYRSMESDEGIWMPDGVQKFTAYLVAYHLSRKPVMVRLDQMAPFDDTAKETN